MKKKPQRALLREIRANRTIYLFISPFFILYAIFGLYPILHSLVISFHKWSGSGQMQYVGLLNYQFLFKDPTFIKAVLNTLIIWCLNTLPMVLLALIFAFLLNLSILRCKAFFRAVYFLPNITSTVAVSIVFSTLFANTYGLLNFALHGLGLEPVKWMSTPFWIRFVIASVVTWRWTGYNTMIALAGLQKIPDTLYDAARIDGASNIKIFTRITLPLLNPTILFIIVTSVIGGWQVMEESFMLVGKSGGIDKAGMTVVLYLYNKAFLQGTFGYGSAVSWGLFGIIGILSVINWNLFQRDTD